MRTNILKPQFKIGEVAAATGVPATTIRQWYARKNWTIGGYDKEAETFGLARLFSGATAIGFKITKSLSDTGVPIKDAAKAALEFAHTGENGRHAGQLFKDGQTYLVVCGSWSTEVNVLPETTVHNMVAGLPINRVDAPLVILPLDLLVIGVVEALGFDRSESWSS